MSQLTSITLTEYQPLSLSQDALPRELGELLWRHYSAQVEVTAPSFQTGDTWRLTAQGWVGHIPLQTQWGNEVRLLLMPKTPLANLFGMLEYAYGLQPFRDKSTDALTGVESLAHFYERLALRLAQQVLERSHRGLYRAYLEREDRLPYVRGRLDMLRTLSAPWQPYPVCHHHQQTANVAENQIIAWTLWRVLHSGLCGERTLPLVRRAFHAVHGPAELCPIAPEAVTTCVYHRLNQDYRPIHALCRFLLAHTGPGHQAGDSAMLPFLIDMARLFELFVAEWLRRHLAPTWQIRAQERIALDGKGHVYFEPDLTLVHAATGRIRMVLDTKYKTPARPAAEDIAQAIAYAHLQGAEEALLIYPVEPAQEIDVQSRGVRVRSLAFRLDVDLDKAGQAFVAALGIEA